MTTVKQILEWPLEYTSGGFTLHIVTAKKKKQVGDKYIQRATVSDGQNEMLASFLLKGNVPLPHNSPVQIKFCRRLELDVNNKAVQAIAVEGWELPQMTAEDWEKEQGDIKKVWDKDQDKRIRGMCRHGIVCAMIRAGYWGEGDIPSGISSGTRQCINGLVDFIMDGK